MRRSMINEVVPPTHLTEQDEGKRIVTSNRTELGEIVEVRNGTPYIDPNPDTLERLKTKFDRGEPDEDAHPLKTVDVAEITDDEVHLR